MGLAQSYMCKPWVLVFLIFLKENFKDGHQVTVDCPPSTSSAVTYHKSFILRRRNNQNADQQHRRFNHHVHHYFRRHEEPNQEQMYDMDVMEPFQDAEQEMQREKRHQNVPKGSEQEETHWLGFRFGNHLQRAGRPAGPEARIRQEDVYKRLPNQRPVSPTQQPVRTWTGTLVRVHLQS